MSGKRNPPKQQTAAGAVVAGEAEVRPFPALKAVPETDRRTAEPEAAPPPAPVQEAPVAATPKKKGGARKVVLGLIGLAALAGAAWYGYDYWTTGRFMVSTDDAYVQVDMSYASPKISGYVSQVLVQENQRVKAGEPLVTIDDGDYRIALEQTEAQIATQQKSLQRIDAQTTAARAALQQAQAQKTSAVAVEQNAARSADRATQLLQTKVGTQATLDDATTALDQARANVASADAQIASAEANIGVLQAQYAEAESSLRTLDLARQKAERDLSFTVLRAPFDGVVGNRSVELGDLVSPGQKLAAVVPLDKLYIVANFKETQLARLVPGEKVKVSVDALADHDFTGTVSSLAPASGAMFSLLPPENATGNFTKVVQRVPVRIEVPKDVLDAGRLRAGLSVVVDVDSRTAPSASTGTAASN
jgi:membrane fusion protein (multidrug efflux system)